MDAALKKAVAAAKSRGFDAEVELPPEQYAAHMRRWAEAVFVYLYLCICICICNCNCICICILNGEESYCKGYCGCCKYFLYTVFVFVIVFVFVSICTHCQY